MKRIKLKSKSDLFLGIGSIGLLAVMWSQTYKLKGNAGLVPRVVLIVGAIAALLICINAFTLKEGVEEKKKPKTPGILIVIGCCVFVFIVAMMLLVEVIGMYTCLYACIAAISVSMTVLENGWNWKKIGIAMLYDLIVILLIYLLFHSFLKINTPTGALI